jgi:archaellum component FlaC
MSWGTLLFLSIAGVTATLSIVCITVVLAIRYRRELPKMPIKESIAALRIEQENIEAEIATLQGTLAEAHEAIQEGERSKEWLENARPAMDDLRAQMTSLQGDQQTAEAECTAAQERLTAVTDEILQKTADLEVLEGKVGPLRSEVAEIEKRLESARSELEPLEQLRQELASLRESVPLLRSEREELESKIERFRKELAELEEALRPLRTLQAQLAGEVEGLTENRNRLIETIEELKKVHSGAGGVAEDHDPCADLWKPYFFDVHTPGGSTDEHDRLEGMQQALDAAGVRLPRRGLLAFHTALKIQDISLLTVLAGISGTGKSLLPRLYAKCMGVNFLNLPVQPGWNSPQDLFGFYNYIEQKFKATPLARAMVQFDQFNRADWIEQFGREDWSFKDANPSLEDQVLLVLLDEMNLARIEYYFSELLSRLETRRSVDTGSAKDRRTAEIPLEIGHGIQKLAAIALYPGDNVLFAGTMNEDESTMSLSDKVLDRATVLRFGKPAEIVSSAPDMSRIKEPQPLTIDAWKGWQSEADVGNESVDVIGQLSDLMHDAGSAFGHRVAQGMIRYVALYPNSQAAGQREAMADQIEQKLLPKLRGKDLSLVESPLQRLSEIVRKLGDDQLVRAIDEGAHSEQGTFMWNGLDRKEG